MLQKIIRVASNPLHYAGKVYSRLTPAGGTRFSIDGAIYNALGADVLDDATLKQYVFTVTRDPHHYKNLLDEAVFLKNSGRWMYHLLLGAAEYGCGNIELALHHFERSIELNSSPFAWHCLGRCYVAMDWEQSAFETFGQGLQNYPENPLLLAEQATSAYRMGQKDIANDIIRPALFTFDEEHEKTQGLKRELDTALAQNLTERQSDSDIYDDKFVTDLWWDYNYSFRRYNRFQEGSAHISHLIRHHVGKILETTAKDAPAVVDFGVMCGTPNYQLARRFPDKQHYGVDRQPIIKTLNDQLYPAANMHFHDGSILDFLDSHKDRLAGGVLFHARTSVCCYPAFLQQMYKKCYDAGIKHIVAIEFSGFSKATREFHDFNDPAHISVALRSIMFIHNHVKLLQDAGYKIVEEKRYSRLGLTIDMGLGESQHYMYATRQG